MDKRSAKVPTIRVPNKLARECILACIHINISTYCISVHGEYIIIWKCLYLQTLFFQAKYSYLNYVKVYVSDVVDSAPSFSVVCGSMQK